MANTSTTTIYRCTNCGYCSTERHFRDDFTCVLCQSSSIEKDRHIESSDGMSSFEYRQLLNSIHTNVSGVGETTIENIREKYPSDDADTFLDRCKTAYTERAYHHLTDISRVGESTAESIAEYLGELKDWEREPFVFTSVSGGSGSSSDSSSNNRNNNNRNNNSRTNNSRTNNSRTNNSSAGSAGSSDSGGGSGSSNGSGDESEYVFEF